MSKGIILGEREKRKLNFSSIAKISYETLENNLKTK